MVRLWIVRHGIAEATAPRGDDGQRRLTAVGRARMQRAAMGLRALDVDPAVILTSPLPRASETAAIVAATIAPRTRPQVLEALIPGTPPADVLRALRPASHHRRVMLVGHEPGLSELAALLLTGSVEGLRVRLRKGGCIALALERLVPPAGVRLDWHLTPKQLRALAG